ncbi:hypothetical protein PA905_25500 [Planktothrix agardhii CCAP 1459/11A]|jgi:multiple sugar transport system permease protein|uniref:Uncharacterized protein n=3 Tax=Planktothrix TaxID=54304 RepID=A0A1J1JCI0_PLAAG|nr:hypothetical protein PLAN_40548 [Planktothrix rubescens NIVA-CYA 18]CAD0231826.1 conserved hypothetical protein [Planktothrix agardhii]CAD5954209.1 hypothetical protein NO108_03115 [Planktothrix rubescens]BBD56273.1 hypothetical protein NIES204_35980 [Planktothrix agardhii NIES-204]GDZ94594.1 hypothetical protein PA905_25500 [Planktothrix agardhii CCAP 1459/11A]
MASSPGSQKQLLDQDAIMAWIFLPPALLLMDDNGSWLD